MRTQYSVWFDATVRHPCGCYHTKQRNPSPHVDIFSFLSSLFSLLVGRYSTPPRHPFLRRPAPFFDRGTLKFGAADEDIRGDSSVITIGSSCRRIITTMVELRGDENKSFTFDENEHYASKNVKINKYYMLTLLFSFGLCNPK